MALTMLKLKTSVGLTKRVLPTIIQAAKHSWEPKEVETHTGQVSCLSMALTMNLSIIAYIMLYYSYFTLL